MDCSMPGYPVLHYLLEFAQTHVHWVDDAIQPFYPLLIPSPSASNLSQHQGLFQWVGSSLSWSKYWNFSISPSNEYSRLISFRIGWFDLLTIQETLKSLFQHHSLKASIPLILSHFYCPALTSLTTNIINLVIHHFLVYDFSNTVVHSYIIKTSLFFCLISSTRLPINRRYRDCTFDMFAFPLSQG